jgi:hypothetical protein
MEYEREQEQAAAAEAAQIGGTVDDGLDYIEEDERPAGISDEAWRPVEEGEASLIERAENPHGPSPQADAEGVVEDPAALDPAYGEADDVHTSEEDPEDTDR